MEGVSKTESEHGYNSEESHSLAVVLLRVRASVLLGELQGLRWHVWGPIYPRVRADVSLDAAIRDAGLCEREVCRETRIREVGRLR
jgi:hypothetical protein